VARGHVARAEGAEFGLLDGGSPLMAGNSLRRSLGRAPIEIRSGSQPPETGPIITMSHKTIIITDDKAGRDGQKALPS